MTLTQSQSRRIFAIVLPILAAALVAVMYGAASWNNQFVYDDHEVIETQFPIHSLHDLTSIFREGHYLDFPYYRPITRTTFAIQETIWGNQPRPYHLFNALLAGLVTYAAYLLLRQPAFRLPRAVALLTAVWFGVHPAVSECIYPAASGRESLLPSLFMLLAVAAWLREGIAWYAVAFALFVLAVFSKEQAVVLPGIFVLGDWLVRRISSWRWLWRYVPIVLLLGGYFIVRHRIFGGGTIHFDIQDHPLEPLAAYVYGIQTAVAPFRALHYEPPAKVWFDPQLTLIAIVALAVLVGMVIRAAPAARRVAVFWLGWFVLLQLPTAHVIQQEADYSERYAALAILGFAATLALLLTERLRRRALSLRSGAALAAGAWALALAFVSLNRAGAYENDLRFATEWAATNPDSSGAHLGLGYIAEQNHNNGTAAQEYHAALFDDPNSIPAHLALADLDAAGNRPEQASTRYEWVLAHDPTNVKAMVAYARMLGGRADHFRDINLRDQSHKLLMQALRLKPDYAQAHFVLGLWDETFGPPGPAIAEFNEALRLQPDLTEAREKLDQFKEVLASTRAAATRRTPASQGAEDGKD